MKLDRLLEAWAEEWKSANLDEATRTLIAQANHDLYCGPLPMENETDYPGFTSACKRIRKALDDAPSTLWIDVESEIACDTEPDWTEHFEEDHYKATRRDVLQALVGRELVAYL